MKTCYYELLGVESMASETDLKKAYRRKALQYHPDKNPDNIEEATQIFNTIRAAYEVLSDPQERAWYDSHREQILNDTEDMDYEVDEDISGVTTDDIMKYFDPTLYHGNNIYEVAGGLFNRIAADEVKFARKYGQAEGKYQDDDLEDKTKGPFLFKKFGDATVKDYIYLRDFYRQWSGFGTFKDFSWKDEYMYSRNYDRRTKREINKRNEKIRNQHKSDYNKTVKRFVTFIKKFDTRMKEANAQFEKEKKIKMQQDLLKQIEKDKRANKENNVDFKLQNWQTVDQDEWAEMEKHFKEYREEPKEEEEELLVYECFVCNKTFKSEPQFQNHEKTNAHKKAVRKVQWEMRKENIKLGLDTFSDDSEFESAQEEADNMPEEIQESIDVVEQDLEGDNLEEELAKKLADIEAQLNVLDDDSDSELDDLSEVDDLSDLSDLDDLSDLSDLDDLSESSNSDDSRDKKNLSEHEELDDNSVENINKEPVTEPTTSHTIDELNDTEATLDDGANKEYEDELEKIIESLQAGNISDEDDWGAAKKKPKKKPKKLPNEPRNSKPKDSTPPIATEECATCGDKFTSRNKLFQHVNATGHASAPKKDKKKNKKR